MSDANRSILVVDDEVDTCSNYRDIFVDLGYEVGVAHEGTAALAILRTRPYDLALLDLKMPGMDGLALWHEIKKQRAGTPAIVVTGFANSALAEDALAAGVTQVLSKPVDMTKLLKLMAGTLDRFPTPALESQNA